MGEFVVLNSSNTVVRGPSPIPSSYSRVDLPGTIQYPVKGNKSLPHQYDGGNGYYTIYEVERTSVNLEEFQGVAYSSGSLVNNKWVIGASAVDWDLNKAKDYMKAQMKVKRDSKRELRRDVIVNSVTYPVSLTREDTENMTAAVLAAVIQVHHMAVPGTNTRDYTFNDQKFTITLSDFITLGLQTLALVDNLHIKQRALKAQIESAGSVADLRLIDTDTGW